MSYKICMLKKKKKEIEMEMERDYITKIVGTYKGLIFISQVL